MRVKYINNEYYFEINSFKKLSNLDIERLVNDHKSGILKMINQNKNNIEEDQILILGKKYKKDEMTKELIDEAFTNVTNMFNHYKIVFNKHDTTLKFRKMKTRWGVCFITKNYITLTKAIIHIPLELIEYIIIHEFCHFTYPNHSKMFYDHVSKYCPDYKKRKKDLKNFSYTLN